MKSFIVALLFGNALVGCSAPQTSDLLGSVGNTGSTGHMHTASVTTGSGGSGSGGDSSSDSSSGIVTTGTGGSGSGTGGAGPVGSGGAGGSECIPKTLAEACTGFSCGMVDAGCGFQVNCGSFPSDPDACPDYQFQSCGLGDVRLDANGRATGQVKPGESNVCGGDCAQMESSADHLCDGNAPHAWYCSRAIDCDNLPNPVFTPSGGFGCVPACGNGLTNVYCCQN